MGQTPVGGKIGSPGRLTAARVISILMLCTALFNGVWARSEPRLYTQETKQFRIVYYSPEHEYLAPLLIRSLENADQFYTKAVRLRAEGQDHHPDSGFR